MRDNIPSWLQSSIVQLKLCFLKFNRNTFAGCLNVVNIESFFFSTLQAIPTSVRYYYAITNPLETEDPCSATRKKSSALLKIADHFISDSKAIDFVVSFQEQSKQTRILFQTIQMSCVFKESKWLSSRKIQLLIA